MSQQNKTKPPRVSDKTNWHYGAWVGLGAATVGLGLALKLPARMWQSLAALFRLDFSLENMEARANPFNDWGSPFPLFPVLMLVLWLFCAVILSDKPLKPSAKKVGSKQFPVIKVVLAVLGIVAIAEVGLLMRSAQLLPNSAGQLPASNFDEMVYYSSARLFAAGNLPYKDFFLAHPPGAIMLFGLFFKLLGLAGGGYDAFLAARWLCILLGLATGVGVWWCAGRMWASGWFARLAVGTLCGLVYVFDVRGSQVAVLETVSNFFAILALTCFLEAQFSSKATAWLVSSGVLAGFAALAKLPGIALFVALLAYLLIRRNWGALLRLTLGFGASVGLLFGGLALLVGMGETVRQVLFFQLLRPQEVREGLDQVARLADYPEAGLTVFLGGISLVVLAWRVGRRNLPNDWRLIPLLWSVPLLLVLTVGKSFHPWYYVQWALPLSLLVGVLLCNGLLPSNREQSSLPQTPIVLHNKTGWGQIGLNLGLAGLVGLVCVPLIARQWQSAQSPDYDLVYKPVADALLAVNPSGTLLTFDPGYGFMSGYVPARMANGKLLVDSAGYMVYLNLEIDRQGWFDLIGAAINPNRERGQVEAIFQRERAQAAVLTALSGGQGVGLDGKIALPQLTPRSVEFIAGASGNQIKIGYVTLYSVLLNPVLREWRFDNGLILKPMGLSSSVDGRANFDPLAADGSLTLKVTDSTSRTLDLRFLWYVPGQRSNPQPAKVFIHVLNEQGEKVAQRDILPLDAKSDTTAWKQGDFYQDVHSLPLPILPVGRYRVEMGLYHPDTLQPIMVEGKASLTLGFISIN